MQDMIVRLAAEADADAIARAQVAAWHRAYVGVIPDDYLEGFTVELRSARWRAILTEPEPLGTTLVAQAPDGVCGFVSVTREPTGEGVAELLALYVSPSHWGLGVGHLLHEAALGLLAARGLERATLWVLEGNARGRGFYGRQGWAPTGHEKRAEYGAASLELLELARSL